MPEVEQPEVEAQETPAVEAEQPEAAETGASNETESAPEAEAVDEIELTVEGQTVRVPRERLPEYAQKGYQFERRMAEVKAERERLEGDRRVAEDVRWLLQNDPEAAQVLRRAIERNAAGAGAQTGPQAAMLPPEVVELVESHRRTKANAQYRAVFDQDMPDEDYQRLVETATKRNLSIEEAFAVTHSRQAIEHVKRSGSGETLAKLKAGQAGASAGTRGTAPGKGPRSGQEILADLGKTLGSLDFDDVPTFEPGEKGKS